MNVPKQLIGNISFGIILVLMLGNNLTFGQSQKDFTISGTHQNVIEDSLEKRVSDIIEAINGPDSWKDFSITGDNPGIGILNKLVDRQQISSIRSAKHLYLLNKPDESVKIKNLYVRTAHTDSLQHRELSLHFNRNGQLIDATLVPNEQNYQLILDRGIAVDETPKKSIKQFVENYHRYLADMNGGKIKSLLARNTDIVNGFISYYNTSSSDPYNFRYLSMTNEEYLGRLNQHIFQKYEDIKIKTGEIEIYKHPLFEDIYAATFSQQWKADHYSDKGYVVMVIDLQPIPKLVFRSWQPHKPVTGSLKFEPDYITEISEFPISTSYQVTLPFKKITTKIPTPQSQKKVGFLETNKRWLLISTATTTALGLGLNLLLNGDETELPDPPGRPTAN